MKNWKRSSNRSKRTATPPCRRPENSATSPDNCRFIVNQLGCRIIHLLPVHPTPTTYARFGRFGSPVCRAGFDRR